MTDYADGIHVISNEEYHGNSAISRSNLVHFNKNPYHYWYNKLSGEAEHKETEAMLMGELIHTLVLEPYEFDNRFAVSIDCDRRTKAGKSSYEQFIIFAQGKMIIKKEQYWLAHAVAESVHKKEEAKWLIQDSRIENSIFFTHQSTGLQCKVRPDIWRDNIIGDLKTTKDASPRGFQRSAMDYYYFLQAGMMKPALASIGIELKEFIIVAVEKEAPYHVGIFPMLNDDIDWGVRQFNRLIEGVARCTEKNEWPGYEPCYLTVPEYAKKQQEE
jgi:hypothetical protein